MEDGGGTTILFWILAIAQFANWSFNVLNEKENREHWALARTREEDSSWQREFVELNFPIVVRVQNGRLQPGSDLSRHFGVGVIELVDLLCLKDSGAYDYGILTLVNEVAATGKSAKRNVVVTPVGGAMVFQCSVCACQELGKEATILGFEIYESWEANADLVIDPGPSPSVIGSSVIGHDRGPSPGVAVAVSLTQRIRSRRAKLQRARSRQYRCRILQRTLSSCQGLHTTHLSTDPRSKMSN